MTTNKGYPLPENLDPENDRCFVVYVPDAPEYVRAFFGSLTGLAKWNVWEKTGNTDGSTAAQRWKRANLRTIAAEKIVDCAFLEELLEDGDMSVNITNNVSCGECGGNCGGGSCTNIPYGPQPEVHPLPPGLTDEIGDLPTQNDPGGETPPPGFPSREIYEAYKCKAARALARDAIDTIGNLATLGTILSAGGLTLLLASLTNTALLSTLAAPLVIALGLTAAPLIGVALVLAALLGAATIGPVMLFYFNQLHDDLAVNIDDITCDLYCSNSPEQARAIFQDYTTVSIGNLIYDDATHESMFSEIVTKVLLFFLPTGYFNLLFAGLDKVQEYIEARDEGFDCSACECEPEEPPDGYLLQDASLITQVSCPANGSMAVDGATAQFLLATTDGSDPSCVASVAHGETEFAAILMQVVWNVGQWRGDNVPSGGLYSNSATYVMGAGNLSAPEIAELSAWAAERGYEWRHATNFPARTNASFNHRHRLEHTVGVTSEMLAYYRFLIPAP